MPLVELVGLDEVLAAEEERVGPAVESLARLPADPVPDRVSHDGGGDQSQVQPQDVEVALRGEEPGGHEQRVAGQEEAHHEAGLGKDDDHQAEKAADPDQLGDVVEGAKEVLNQVQNKCLSVFPGDVLGETESLACSAVRARARTRVRSGVS